MHTSSQNQPQPPKICHNQSKAVESQTVITDNQLESAKPTQKYRKFTVQIFLNKSLTINDIFSLGNERFLRVNKNPEILDY